jgi:hypothetical protein
MVHSCTLSASDSFANDPKTQMALTWNLLSNSGFISPITFFKDGEARYGHFCLGYEFPVCSIERWKSRGDMPAISRKAFRKAVAEEKPEASPIASSVTSRA